MEIGKVYGLLNEPAFIEENLDGEAAVNFHNDLCKGAWTVEQIVSNDDGTAAVFGNSQVAYLVPEDQWRLFGDYIAPEESLQSGWEPATGSDLDKLRDSAMGEIFGNKTPINIIAPVEEVAAPVDTPLAILNSPSVVVFKSPKDEVTKEELFDLILPHMPHEINMRFGTEKRWVSLSGSPEEKRERLVKVVLLKRRIDGQYKLIAKTGEEYQKSMSELDGLLK